MDIQMDDIPYSLHQMVEIIGMKNFLKLCKMYGGYTLYIPVYNKVIMGDRNRNIVKEYNGKNIAGGVGLAVVLWGVFWLGDKASAWLFDFARPQVELIYGMKTGENPWLLSVLLLILIGPAEEIFWRGYVQNALSKRWSPNVGFIVTTLVYALVHIWSFNFMLVMAALVVGAIWGLAYRLYPQKLGALIVSHAVWDVAVFVVFPI